MKKLFLSLVLIAGTVTSHCQSYAIKTVFEDWFTTDGTQNFFYKGEVISDATGNTYMCGATINQQGNYDMLVSKYSSSGGTLLWSAQYNGNGNGLDGASSIALDANGDVYICGTTYESPTDSNNCIVRKYNGSTGSLIWSVAFNGTDSRHDGWADICIHKNRICVTGVTFHTATLYDILTISYDTSGTQQWIKEYNYSGLFDGGIRVSHKKKGNAFIVAAGGQSSTTNFDYLTLGYRVQNGQQIGPNISTGSQNGFDEIADVATDTLGNIYITGGAFGYSGFDYLTIKMDSTLTGLWSATYSSPGILDDKAKSIVVDDDGGVYVTGYTTKSGSGADYMTIKYSSSGAELWRDSFNGAGNAGDTAKALVLDRWNRNVYVTGTSFNGTTYDYHTLKLDTAGVKIWEIDFNSWRNVNDIAHDLAVDSAGGLIVNGQSQVPGILTYNTVRYIDLDVITPPDPVPVSSAFNFEQNRGQLYNTDTIPDPNIKFYHKSSWPAVYFADTSVSYVWARIDSSSATTDSTYRVDMKLVNGNMNNVLPMNKREQYYNYLLGYLNFPKALVPLYSHLFYPEVYSKIDLMYASNNRGLKHYFIMRIGGNPSEIEISFNGADSMKVVNDSLYVYTRLGILKQPKAEAFEIDNSGNRVNLSWQPDYLKTVNGTIVFSNIGSYNFARTLVFECDWGSPVPSPVSIDNLEWSTFLGAGNNDFSNDITVNDLTNFSYVTGYTYNYPFAGQIGFTQLPFNGGVECYVGLFDDLAVSQWVSYIGGSGYEESRRIALDDLNQPYVIGYTISTDFIDMISNGIDYNDGTGTDGFFVALNSSGTGTVCDSYIPGNGTTIAQGVAVKKGPSGNDIYIVGVTTSTNFPIQSSGNYNQTSNAGGYDAFVMRLDQNFNNVWSSYFGSSNSDEFTDVDLRQTINNPVIVGTGGEVYASNPCAVPSPLGGFPFCDNGGNYYSQAFTNSTDNLIVEFDNSNQQLIWSTFFGGGGPEPFTIVHSGEPNVAIINDNVYILGSTGYVSGFPLLSSSWTGAYNQGNNNSGTTGSIYLARFDASRNQVWTTLYGGKGGTGFAGYDIVGDVNNNVYITGKIPTMFTPNSSDYCIVPNLDETPICNYSGLNYMETTPLYPSNDYSRMFIAAFDQYDEMKWSTFFGNNVGNYGKGVHATADKVFVSAGIDAFGPYTLVDFNTSSNLDYFLPTNQGGNDAGISRFDITALSPVFEHNILNHSALLLFPNPAQHVVYLQLPAPISGDFKIQITDALGRVLLENKENSNETVFILDVGPLSEGIYFVQVASERISMSNKMIIHR